MSKVFKPNLNKNFLPLISIPDFDNDPYIWLESIEGANALQWVQAQNGRTETCLTRDNSFKQMKDGILAILDAENNIPVVSKIGEGFYNFWTDASHPSGLWRRTSLDEYRKETPSWETILDLDALNRSEGENWVWHGATWLRPNYQRCLIVLSRGGSDATVTREFDLKTKTWIENGFFLPEAKGGLSWIDINSVYVFTDFGDGTMTASGYPRIVKQWKRGSPLSAASVVYEGLKEDLSICAMHDDTPGYERGFVFRALAFYQDELFLRTKDGGLTKIDVPNSAKKWLYKDWLLIELREEWEPGEKYVSGSLIAINFDEFIRGKQNFNLLFKPTGSSSLVGLAMTKSHLILNELRDAKSCIRVLTPDEERWQCSELTIAQTLCSLDVRAVDIESDSVWIMSTGYLTPTKLYLVEIGQSPETLKTMPHFFDSSTEIVEQHFAKSKDGTLVPYFLVRPTDLKFEGSAPTLLYGYGGFEISMTPNYSGSLGNAWLSRGGIYAVANIRGGGEYGPRWHQAALRENRNRSYEDFAAVAEDLFNRKITAPRHLGIQGASNGGLLTGNMLTQYPNLFGAVVVQAPLLDMRRFNKLLAGASWMEEYGNPDNPEHWAYIREFSPYHLFDSAKSYPPVFFLTSTRDDRVHPGHARKMAAKMIDAHKNVAYYENTEGGHSTATCNYQFAHIEALIYSFLWKHLAGEL